LQSQDSFTGRIFLAKKTTFWGKKINFLPYLAYIFREKNAKFKKLKNTPHEAMS
jgi:hypothetical protein